jgi:hypothetical protein
MDFLISQSVSPWQASPASSNFCGSGQEPTLEWSTSNALHSGRLQPYPQKLDYAVEACQGQTLQLIMKICKLRP